MRIGLTGGGSTPDRIIEQAERAEADGFHSLWFASGVQGDPLVAIALAGRATSKIELGTAVLQTYPCHPLLQAQRAASVAAAMGRPGFTLGVGPSHESNISGIYGLSYEHPGRNTEEYVRIVAALLRGEAVDFDGEDWTVHAAEGAVAPTHPIPLLLSALSPRMLRIAGEHADGTVLWTAPRSAIEEHIAPRLVDAARAAGRPAPRIVAGLPVVVTDDEADARAAIAAGSTMYASQPNYQRILALGGVSNAGDAAVVGDEKSVEAQLRALLAAGATDIHAAIVPVGDDRRRSMKRTSDLLSALARE
jgi:F420-dependent oxidoreductase-like protein